MKPMPLDTTEKIVLFGCIIPLMAMIAVVFVLYIVKNGNGAVANTASERVSVPDSFGDISERYCIHVFHGGHVVSGVDDAEKRASLAVRHLEAAFPAIAGFGHAGEFPADRIVLVHFAGLAHRAFRRGA